MSRWDKRVRLSLYETKRLEFTNETYDVPLDLVLYVVQGDREIAPVVTIELEHKRDDVTGMRLTVAEARRLAAALDRAVQLTLAGNR